MLIVAWKVEYKPKNVGLLEMLPKYNGEKSINRIPIDPETRLSYIKSLVFFLKKCLPLRSFFSLIYVGII